MNLGNLSYLKLIEKYLENSISIDDLINHYFEKFKNDNNINDTEFFILDELFGDLDSFTRDQELLDKKPDFFLNEAALKDKIAIAATRLTSLGHLKS